MDERFIPAEHDGPKKLAHLCEECAELIVEAAAVVKEVQKIVRFGADTRSPEGTNDPNTTPRERLRNAVLRLKSEMGDVNFAIARLNEALDL